MSKIEADKEPEFNAGIAYLERLDKLMKMSTNFYINGQNELFYLSLSQLQTEIMPRMTNDMIITCNMLEMICKQLYYNSNKRNNILFSQKLISWQRQLYLIAHQLKLIMPDKGGGAAASQL